MIDINSKIAQFNMIWVETPTEKREELIKSLGFHTSFSICNSLEEMANRSGGWLAKRLLNLYIKGGFTND